MGDRLSADNSFFSSAESIKSNGYIYSEDDIRYALPEHLFDIGKVERAIELAKDDLVNKYGLPDPDIFIFGDSEIVAEDCVRQITLFELLSEELPKAA